MSKALEKLSEGIVIPALPLALDENRVFDEKTQRRLIRYYLEAGAGGIAVAVHTTQFEIRDPSINIFETLLKTAYDEIQKYEIRTGKTIVKISGVCGDSKQAVSEAQIAKKIGYDAVLLSPGGLSSHTEDMLVSRTKSVADVLPVIAFYLQVAVGGRKFSYSYWEQLCAIDNLVAIKIASFDRYLTLDALRAVAFSPRKNDITLYTGNDDNIIIDLLTEFSFRDKDTVSTVSFKGGLLGHWAAWTSKAVEHLNLIKEQKKSNCVSKELLTLAAKVTDANSALFDTNHDFEGCIVGIHEVLFRQGLLKNLITLNPKEVLTSSQSTEIDRVYRMYPELNDDEFVTKFLENDNC